MSIDLGSIIEIFNFKDYHTFTLYVETLFVKLEALLFQQKQNKTPFLSSAKKAGLFFEPIFSIENNVDQTG